MDNLITDKDIRFCLQEAKYLADYCKKNGVVNTTKLVLIVSLINYMSNYAIMGSITKEFVEDFFKNEKSK